MASKAEGAFCRTARPDGPQIDTDRRKDRHMEDSQDALRKFFRLLKLECNAAKSKIEYARATAALVADDGVGVGSDHGNPFRFALDREGWFGNGGGNLFCQGSGADG